jgi:hypothetical protein
MQTGSSARRRPATVTVELVLVLPVLLIVLMGTIEFGMLLTARQELLAASREGARVASHGGGDRKALAAEVRDAVRESLGDGRLSDADVDVDWAPEGRRERPGDRERVEVTVHLPARHVVPDLLGWAGLSIARERLEGSTVMLVEK